MFLNGHHQPLHGMNLKATGVRYSTCWLPGVRQSSASVSRCAILASQNLVENQRQSARYSACQLRAAITRPAITRRVRFGCAACLYRLWRNGRGCVRRAFAQRIGAGGPDRGSHPRAARREELYAKYGVRMFEENREAVLAAQQIEADAKNISGASLVILAVKPQRLSKVLHELKGSILPSQLVVSIVAGARTDTIAEALIHPAVVRTMPNTPAQIGQGMTAWTATDAVTEEQERAVCAMLEALGKPCASRTKDRSTWLPP